MRPVVRTLLAVEESGAIPIPPGQAGTGGSISCPPGTVPWGGGASFTGGIPSVGEDINSSAPTDVGWTARYNNRSSRMDDAFGLSAVCANKPAGYTMRFKTVPNPRRHSRLRSAPVPPALWC